MQRSAIYSCLLDMPGFGHMDSNLSGVIITDISDWWDKMPKDLQRSGYECNLYNWVQTYSNLVVRYFGDRKFLSVDDPANRHKLSQDTQRWEAWASVLTLHNERKRLIRAELDSHRTSV